MSSSIKGESQGEQLSGFARGSDSEAVNDTIEKDTQPQRRFVLTIWSEPRDSRERSQVLRGSILPIPPEGSREAAKPPQKAYFETLNGLVPALRKFLSM